MDPIGVRLSGARITGELSLDYVTIPFPIDLTRCRLTAEAHLVTCRIPMLSLTGSWTCAVTADGAAIRYSIYLDGGFRADGEVSLNGAQIGEGLECDEGTFIGKKGDAIQANYINVGGAVFLRAGSAFNGSQGRSAPRARCRWSEPESALTWIARVESF